MNNEVKLEIGQAFPESPESYEICFDLVNLISSISTTFKFTWLLNVALKSDPALIPENLRYTCDLTGQIYIKQVQVRSWLFLWNYLSWPDSELHNEVQDFVSNIERYL